MNTFLVVSVVLVLLQIVVLYLAADFTGGLFHWAEDTFGDAETPVWGPIFVRPNERHHHDPTEMLRHGWLYINRHIIIGTLVIVAGVWLAGAMTWQFLVFAAFAGLNQTVHAFAHTPTVRLPRPVRLLQRARIIQDGRDHWMHHRAPHMTAYCVLTPWLNPLLDQIGFWRMLERPLARIFPTPRRPDIAAG